MVWVAMKVAASEAQKDVWLLALCKSLVIDFMIAISLFRQLSYSSSDNQPSLKHSCCICVSTPGEAGLFPADADQKLARLNNALALSVDD